MRGEREAWAALLAISLTTYAGCTGENKPATQRSAQAAGASAVLADSTSAAAARAGRPVILFLGTSLTAGLGLDPDSAYPARIQAKLDSAGMEFEVVNAGVSGETAAGLLRRLDWVLRRPASVIVVETGANDGLRGQPVSATQATIGKILERIAREQPSARVLLVQMEAPTNLGARYTKAFHDLYPTVAREHGVTLLPFLLDSVAGVPSLNQADGIHPNDRGERIVAENVWRGLQGALAGE
jgi:acyl-CoA thioesterase I